MSVRSLVALVSFASLLVPASGSTLEDATDGFVSYQFDGGSHHDAPDLCSAAGAGWSAADGSTDGMLVAPDDVSDVYVLDVPADRVGARLHLSLLEPTGHPDLELQTFAPGCAGSVLDAANWPDPAPAPPAAGQGERQSDLRGLEPRTCDADLWQFWAEIMPGIEPAPSIHAAWTDGTELTLPLARTHGSAHAVYATDHALAVKPKGAWINMPDGWQGEFFLAKGPCGTADGGAVYGEPPIAGMASLGFTPTRAGAHVVQVTYRGTAGDALTPIPAPVKVDPAPLLPSEPSDPTGATGGLLGHGHEEGEAHTGASPPGGLDAPAPAPLAMPRSCHWCAGPIAKEVLEKLSYRIVVSTVG